MIDRIRERVSWIEQNVLPYERAIRAWLMHQRVRDLETDDIIQEMYAKIGSVDDFETIRAPKYYALQVARSILLNHARRPHIVSITEQGNLDELGVASAHASPEDEAIFRDEIRQVVSTLAALPERTRQVLLLRRIEGLSQRETARRLSIAEKTVEKHLARAVLILMDRFGRGGKSASRSSGFTVHDAGSDERHET